MKQGHIKYIPFDPDGRLFPIIAKAIERYPKFLNHYWTDDSWEHALGSFHHNERSRDSIIEMVLNHNEFVIYTKEFAQAFWFDVDKVDVFLIINSSSVDGHYVIHNVDKVIEVWQYHQIQMILADDPIEYLEGFLDENDKTV